MKNLYEVKKYLIENYTTENIKNFLNKDKNYNFEPLECITWILSYEKYIFDEYHVQDFKSNFNLGFEPKLLEKCNLKEIPISRSGDISDITFFNKKTNTIMPTTIKNLSKIQLNNLDIQQIKQYHTENFSNYNLQIIIIIPNKDTLLKMNGKKSSTSVKNTVNQSIILDYTDIISAYKNFLQNSVKDKYLFHYSKKEKLNLTFFQKMAIFTFNKFHRNKTFLLGFLPRVGKSITFFSICKKYSKSILVTSYPNETIKQYKEDLSKYSIFEDFTIIHLNNTNEIKLNDNDKYIFLVSAQFLKINCEKLNWLKNINFDICGFDEAHNGGTTNLTETTLNEIVNYNKIIYITATFSKPVNKYSINTKMLCDLEDIYLAKNSTEIIFKEKMYEKYEPDILDKLFSEYTFSKIKESYFYYPQLEILSVNLTKEFFSKIPEKLGISLKSILTCQDNKFILENKNKTYLTSFLNFIFSLKEKESILFRANQILKLNNSRNFDDTMLSVMCFLPLKNIDMNSMCLKRILDECNFNLEVCCINSKTGENPITIIDRARFSAQKKNKKGVLILSGLQCSTGVTLKHCDIVFLLNDTCTSFDMIYQMMFRCLSADTNKKCGLVVDVDFSRCLTTVSNIASNITGVSLKDKLEYIINQRLVGFNFYNPDDNFDLNTADTLTKLIQDNNNIDCYLRQFNGLEIEMNEELRKYFKDITKIANDKKTKYKTEHSELDTGMDTVLISNTDLNKNEIDDNEVTNEIDDNEVTNEIEDNEVINEIEDNEVSNVYDLQINPADIFQTIIPLLSIVTCNCDSIYFNENINYLKQNDLERLFIEQSRKWYKNIKNDFLDFLLKLYKYNILVMDKLNDFIDLIKTEIKKSKKNKQELSKLIDKYLIPTETEKKENAEVSTPYTLRQEMLSKIDTYAPELWKNKNSKIFEPCCGKGGFVIDIYERLRQFHSKKHILENMLYFADINETNIFITKLLLDPDNKYKLNYFLGNTLKLKINEKWKEVEGFDAIIGNPPYQDVNASGDNKYYLSFTRFGLSILKTNGLLLFITPTNIIDYILCVEKNRSIIDKLYNIVYIAIDTPKKYFTVNSTFTYFLLFKEDYTNNTTIEHLKGIEKLTLVKGIQIPKIPSKINLDIMAKITSNTDNYQFKSFTFNKKSRRIRKQHIEKNIVSTTKTGKYKYKIIDTINITNQDGTFYYYDKLDDDINKNKIIFSKKGYLMPTYDNKHQCTYSDNFLFVEVKNDKLMLLFKSKIIDYLCFHYSKNGFDKINSIKSLKKINCNFNTITDIYNYYQLTEKEIEIIENC